MKNPFKKENTKKSSPFAEKLSKNALDKVVGGTSNTAPPTDTTVTAASNTTHSNIKTITGKYLSDLKPFLPPGRKGFCMQILRSPGY
jgi:hypothetical protein